MQIVFYSVVLNQHQAPVADLLWELTQHNYVFVELKQSAENKGGTEDYSNRPYLLRAWESQSKKAKAMELAMTADCCVFAGIESLPFEKERLKRGLLSFEMGERWLKYGFKSLASPRLLKWLMAYYLGGWGKKPLYKLCCSAFCKLDHKKLKTFDEKCYKWGYFTKVNETIEIEAPCDFSSSDTIHTLMWCARFLKCKHPELPVLLAEKLKSKGFLFRLDMYGSGEMEEQTKQLATQLGVLDVVTFHGAVTNNIIHEAMRKAEIFLFTSDRHEGWGAVANESLSESCVLVASDAIGSSPYLISDGINGFMFKSSKSSCSFDNPDRKALDSIYKKVEYLLTHPQECKQMQHNAEVVIKQMWSPDVAAKRFLALVQELKNGNETPFLSGPCSKA